MPGRLPFIATMMDATTGGEQVYHFSANIFFAGLPCDEIVESFMDHIRAERFGDQDAGFNWELTSCHKNREHQVVVATGNLLLHGGEIPFVLMISPHKAGTGGSA